MPTISVFGATGFTGSLVARYLVKHAPPDVQISLVGRSLSKLQGLSQTLAPRPHEAKSPSLVIASSDDASSIDSFVAKSQVVVCTAGPFLRVAGPIVASCARQGVDYVDITGETPFVRQTIDLHDATAKNTGALIVNMCGFDSIPSDLGCWRTVERVRSLLGEGTRRVSCFVTMRGQLSGGTLESGMEMERNPALYARLKDPFLLGGRPESTRTEDEDVKHASPLSIVPSHSSASDRTDHSNKDGAWTSVFMMAELNTRTVRRSHSLFEGLGRTHPTGYGLEFGYNERLLCATSEEALKHARPPPPVTKRESMRSEGRLPKQGEGPSEEERGRSRFKFFFVGEGEDSGRRVLTSVAGGDPGYDETAKMVSEAALALALNRDELHAVKEAGLAGGVLTPAFTFGTVLEHRLQSAGISLADEGVVFESNESGEQELISRLSATVSRPSQLKDVPRSKL